MSAEELKKEKEKKRFIREEVCVKYMGAGERLKERVKRDVVSVGKEKRGGL